MESSTAGFDAFGNPVPDRRKTTALKHLRAMHPDLSTEEEMEIVGKVASSVEADQPFEAMRKARDVLDLTGAYRLLAALCVGESNGD